MKLHLYSLCLCLLVFTASHAQKFNVTVSPETDDQPEEARTAFGPSYFTYQTTDKLNKFPMMRAVSASKLNFGLKLKKFDSQGVLLKEAALADGNPVFAPYEPEFVPIGNSLYLFYCQYISPDGKSGFRCLYAPVDTATMTLGAPKEFVSANQEFTPYIGKFYSGSILRTVRSPDSSKTALMYVNLNNKNEFSIRVVNQKFETLWEKTEALSDEKYVAVRGMALSNDGNSLYVCHVYLVSNSETRGTLALFRPHEAAVENQIKMDGFYPEQITLLPFWHGNEMRIAGTYCQSGTQNVNGCFTTDFSAKDLSVLSQKQVPFPADAAEELRQHGRSWVLKGTPAGTQYQVYTLCVLSDSSLRFTTQFEDSYVGNGMHSRTRRDFFSLRMAEDKVNWSIVQVFRPDYSSSSHGISYGTIPYKDKTILFYNESPENINKPPDAKPSRTVSSYAYSILTAVIIEADGTMKKVPVVDLSGDRFTAQLFGTRSIGPDTYAIPFLKLTSKGDSDKKSKNVIVQIQ